MLQVDRPAAERVLRTGWRHELLKLRQVVELEAVGNHWPDAQAFAELHKAGLAAQARGRRIGIEKFNRRGRLLVLSANIDEAPVHLAAQREIQPAQSGQLMNGLDHA